MMRIFGEPPGLRLDFTEALLELPRRVIQLRENSAQVPQLEAARLAQELPPASPVRFRLPGHVVDSGSNMLKLLACHILALQRNDGLADATGNFRARLRHGFSRRFRRA